MSASRRGLSWVGAGGVWNTAEAGEAVMAAGEKRMSKLKGFIDGSASIICSLATSTSFSGQTLFKDKCLNE
jgi:hypothetical protein